ncbi:glutamine hydrolyzing CTP synthase [Methanolapillus millepedarum]|uniref:CTP synthase (glutamine hydrolyzing) n=1 Tax=Methanolapillus millepedarum TaxID=3028296 RepID=A0AA97A359_9EURY|nr:CTP synthase [Methanosarcinaceae archaeon Ac7]
MKYIVVTGGVISGLGKGITTASIGRNLKNRGYKVTALKIDPYLNVDAGIMSPLQHGEIFVLKDGGEVDLDLGNYERFLDTELTADHDITTGKVYQSVINRERRGEYLGKTVQIIPHITNEIKGRVRRAAEKSGAEICIIEVGGTVGDIESMSFLEAIRQMKNEEKHENMKFVHVTLAFDDTQGEQKTKPTQHSVKEMRTLGLSPDFIVGRATYPLKKETKEKIALFCDVREEYVASAYNVSNLYEIPLILDKEGITDHLIEELKLPKIGRDNTGEKTWSDMVSKMNEIKQIPDEKAVRLAIVGKYTDLADSYISLFEAIKHGSTAAGVKVVCELISSEKLECDDSCFASLETFDGIIVPGGFGERGTNGMIRAIRCARENNIPFLGIGLGMQMAVVEFARNVVGLESAHTTEFNEKTKYPVIDTISENNDGTGFGGIMRLGEFEITLKEGTKVREVYGESKTFGRYRNRYEINSDFIKTLGESGLVFSGDIRGAAQAIELPDKKFFVGTQYHPQFKSRPTRVEPLIGAFVKSMKE